MWDAPVRVPVAVVVARLPERSPGRVSIQELTSRIVPALLRLPVARVVRLTGSPPTSAARVRHRGHLSLDLAHHSSVAPACASRTPAHQVLSAVAVDFDLEGLVDGGEQVVREVGQDRVRQQRQVLRHLLRWKAAQQV